MASITAADNAMKYALQQVGKPYVWGGVGPDGFDCSGLMLKAYQAGGVTIPRTSQMQARFGQAIGSIDKALPGDLVFPYVDESHVAMFLGNGTIIEAPQTGIPVHVVKFYGASGGIRRVVDGGGSAVDASITNQSGSTGGSTLSTSSTFEQFMTGVKITFQTLTNPKEWASFGLLILGVCLVIMVGITAVGKEVF